MRVSSDQRGFTLIELSIVLVIIGLIAGSVLVGKDLIYSASIRRQIKQIQDYEIAVNAFRTKYDCIPGDCYNITTFLGNTDPNGNPIYNGNANGIVDTANGTYYDDGNSNWPNSKEMWGAFQQLSVAKMIPFAVSQPSVAAIGKSFPSIYLNSSAGFFISASYNFNVNAGGRTPATLFDNPNGNNYERGSNAFWFVVCSATAVTNNQNIQVWDDGCGIFKAADLQKIETKIDDGDPLGGRIISFGGNGNTNIDTCLISSSSSPHGYAYDTADPNSAISATAQCQMAYVLQ